MTPLIDAAGHPVCPRCENPDRRLQWGFDTDFGGHVEVFGCQRCGTVFLDIQGQRPKTPAECEVPE